MSSRDAFGRNPKLVRPMGGKLASVQAPGHPLAERIAATALIEHQAHEALRRGDVSTYNIKIHIVRERRGRGLSADYYTGPRPWL